MSTYHSYISRSMSWIFKRSEARTPPAIMKLMSAHMSARRER